MGRLYKFVKEVLDDIIELIEDFIDWIEGRNPRWRPLRRFFALGSGIVLLEFAEECDNVDFRVLYEEFVRDQRVATADVCECFPLDMPASVVFEIPVELVSQILLFQSSMSDLFLAPAGSRPVTVCRARD